jgi:biotin synthase-like enzyme
MGFVSYFCGKTMGNEYYAAGNVKKRNYSSDIPETSASSVIGFVRRACGFCAQSKDRSEKGAVKFRGDLMN